MKFHGIYTPAVTPYHDDGSINWKGFSDCIEHLASSGVHGIILGGSTGEYYAQTAQERYDLNTRAKDIIKSTTSLIVGTGAIRTEDSIEYGKAAKAAGADAILITTPPYALPTEEENAIHALRVDEATGLPIMLYNYPGRMGVTMGEDYFTRVSKSPNVQAIKESTGSMESVHMLARQFPNIALSCGWDDQALEFFAWGATSWVCAGSNFLPSEHIALYEACVVEKNFDKGRRIMSAFLPFMNFLDAGKFVQSIKFGVSLVGLDAGPPRAPLQPLTGEVQEKLKEIVRTVKSEISDILKDTKND
ncbi:dihydrodipicolinate synthase family protein [Acetobacter cibinongensis]|uniref:Dihydrodipicolinate synthetase n=1 Tax=Acetobacter cibinongensis TaxID=146475 RepID=A0A1Z5YX50_9PROT|nr:dihydrodipicolinate synthase family protein [Acetobacter cibinongensis]OUJ03895.1 dihydrodipicolinate synthetase [Acetobacter cibinongensis]